MKNWRREKRSFAEPGPISSFEATEMVLPAGNPVGRVMRAVREELGLTPVTDLGYRVRIETRDGFPEVLLFDTDDLFEKLRDEKYYESFGIGPYGRLEWDCWDPTRVRRMLGLRRRDIAEIALGTQAEDLAAEVALSRLGKTPRLRGREALSPVSLRKFLNIRENPAIDPI